MLRSHELFYNQVKRLLREGKKTIGAWLQAASPVTAEIIAKAGFDFALVDMEHGPGDMMTLFGQLQAMAKYDITPLVRVPGNDAVAIKRVLDAGAHGVLVPTVATGGEAAAAVGACKYPLLGIRGLAASPRANGFGMDGLNYLENANEHTLVMVAAETLEAVENIGELAATPGLDGIFVGPMDLAASMGHFCNPASPEVREAIARIEKAVLGSGKFLGSVAADFEQARQLYDKGYGLVVVMSDSTSLARLALDNVGNFRAAYPGR